jgi:hypothetical protein
MGSWSKRRRPAAPTPKADHHTVAAARAVRRTAQIREALRVREEPLTHEWLAEQTGVPLGYLRWRFPVLDDLHHELGKAS